MKHSIYTALVCTLLLCACNKEDDIVDFPVTLYAHEISQVSNVRLFVNKKEIHNSNAIKSFVNNPQYSDFFLLPTNTEIQSSNESICFLSKDSFLFGSSTIVYTVQKDAKKFLFHSPLYFVSPDYYYGENLIRSLLKYPGDLFPMGPYSLGATQVFVGYGSYKNLEISFLSYVLSTSRWVLCGRLFNEFNEEAIKNLQLQDTLAIQEYKIRFIARY
jgi:hypothetical protein